MPNLTIPNPPTQLSLFDAHQQNAHPLPLLVARDWNFPLACHETNTGTMYAVQDWIAGLASCEKTKAAELWRKMEIQTGNSITSLPYTASDGKTYQRPFTDAEGLYQIAQHMRSTKKRPILSEIKEYLAKSGVFVDRQRLDPEIGVNIALTRYQKQGKPDTLVFRFIYAIIGKSKRQSYA
jgi:hypothetical protein